MLEANVSARGILLFWDNKVLEFTGMEVGIFLYLVNSRTMGMVSYGVFLGFMVEFRWLRVRIFRQCWGR